MRHVIAALAVLVVTVAASAQYKPPTSTPQAKPGTPATPVTANPNVVITPGAPQVEHSLESARRINRADAMKMVAAKKAIYVDVRGKEQYDIEHIKGAISMPLGELAARMQELPKDKFLITYCA